MNTIQYFVIPNFPNFKRLPLFTYVNSQNDNIFLGYVLFSNEIAGNKVI